MLKGIDEVVTHHKTITSETLKKWEACPNGFERFCELFPEGATLKVASDALIADGHADWSNWLWEQCKNDIEYLNQTHVVAGYKGTATAGDYGTATVGKYGKATAGYFGKATAEDYGAAIAGYGGTAKAGDYGEATVGDYGAAIAGKYGEATAGYKGTAIAGYKGTTTAGKYGKATAGMYGNATAGDYGTATVGKCGVAIAGYEGCISLFFYDGSNFIRRMFNIGEGGLKPNTPYQLDEHGNPVEVK